MSLSFSLNLSGSQLPRLQYIDSISADDADSESLPELNQEELSFSGDVVFTETNPKYQEILKLDKLLTIAGIPHRTSSLFDGWEVAYIQNNEKISDAVEHIGSYGMENDRLEISGLEYLLMINPEKILHTEATYGNLNALEIFAFWSQNYRRSNPDYKKDNFLKAWKEILKSQPNSEECKLLREYYSLSDSKKITADTLEYFTSAELTETAAMAVLFGDTEFITMLTGYQTRKHLLSYILDELIQTAVNQKNYDIQLMLTDYKYRHNLFRQSSKMKL